jgi:hypothetical protein
MHPLSNPDRAARRRAILSLLLLVPAPSIGVLFGMILFPNTAPGVGVFLLSKVWLFCLPAFWYLRVERQAPSLSPPRRGGFGPGIVSGLLLSALIGILYAGLGDRLIDGAWFRERIHATGLGTPGAYLGGVLYWILINSALEEYVWRWFCYRQFETVFPPRVAVVASAVCFTLHHALALQVYLPPLAVAGGALGVCVAGLVWSALYRTYRSVWPGYVSHALVDGAVFLIGARILFRS